MKSCLILAVPFLAALSFATSYTTNFPATESPITQGGKWLSGGVVGNGDVATTPGFAYGVNQVGLYGDPAAILSGTWGTNQQIQGKVKVNSQPGDGLGEIEFHLRTTFKTVSKTITGYEIYCSVVSNNRYCKVARWNGGQQGWCNIAATRGTDSWYAADGDVFKATITGTSPNPAVITLYRQAGGTGAFCQVLTVSDTGTFGIDGPDCGSPSNPKPVYYSGSPGVGFWRQSSAYTWGWANVEATDSAIPQAASWREVFCFLKCLF